MIHPDDWEILLREPRADTVVDWLIWLFFTGPVMILALAAGWRRLRDSRAPARAGLLTVGALLILLTGYGIWHGVNIRLVQAACWRGGPDAVSETWKAYCHDIPPQGVEDYY